MSLLAINNCNDHWSAANVDEDESALIRSCESAADVNIAIPRKPSGSSWWASALIVVNAALGAGLLNFPDAFHRAGGIGVAMVVQAVFVVMATFSLVVMAFCSDIRLCATYQETVRSLCGKWLGIICTVAIAVYSYFTCVTFLVIVGDQADRVFADKFGHDFCYSWYMNRRFVVSVLAVIVILPFCYSRRIDFLKHASAIATIGVLYLVILVVANYFIDRSDEIVDTKPKLWTDVFLVIPAICFGYQCHVSVVPVYSCLEPRNVTNFTRTVLTAMFVCLCTYSMVGIFGYLTYGDDVRADLWSSMDTRQPWILVGLLVFAAKTFLTYPILLFCGRTAVESILLEVFGPTFELKLQTRVFRFGLPSVWFFSSILLTIVVPNIGFIIGALGSLAATFIFVFPGCCMIQAILMLDEGFTRIQRNVGLFVAVVYIVLGCFVFGTVLTQDIRTILHRTNEPPVCYA